jgi:hypothetical protein
MIRFNRSGGLNINQPIKFSAKFEKGEIDDADEEITMKLAKKKSSLLIYLFIFPPLQNSQSIGSRKFP